MSAASVTRATIGIGVAGAIALLGLPASASAEQVTFSYTGASQSFTVPGVNRITIDAVGAGGGDLSNRATYGLDNLPGGLGGEAVSSLSVTSGETLQVNVGGKGAPGLYWLASGVSAGGFNGGGDSGGAINSEGASGGGGASDVRRGGTALTDRVVVAGGGGGSSPYCLGGEGGGATGGSGTDYPTPPDPVPGDPSPLPGGCGAGPTGGPGTQTSGGGGGSLHHHSGVSSEAGGSGALGTGGNGGATPDDGGFVGAGGGGGYFGGGGGASSRTVGYASGSGGGGSGYTPDGTGLSSGVNGGNGSVTITYVDVSVAVSERNAVVDDRIQATATLNDASAGRSFMTFEAYGPEDFDCSEPPAFTGVEIISADGTVQSGDFQPQGVGDYRWVVTYNNLATGETASSPCNDPSTTPGNLVTVAPPMPTDFRFSPASPANDNAPRISGEAFPGSTVTVTTEPDCSGAVVAQGPSSTFTTSGFALSVPDNSTTTYYAEVGGGPVGSGCSTESGTYVEDSTPPVAAIDSEPPALSNEASAAFTYSSNEAGSSFECALDSQTMVSCPAAGTDYTGLADGPHTFEVQATDRAGNVSVSESYSWTIDTVPPQTTFLDGPSGTTSDATPTFGFSSSEPDSTFECRIDDGDFSSCDSPYTTSVLAEGAHAISVRATDAAGNVEPTVALRTFRVQFGAPQTTIASGPSGTVHDLSQVFTFASSKSDSTFECRMDDSAYSRCESPYTVPPLADGPHAFSVRATDADGDTDETAALGTFNLQTVSVRVSGSVLVVKAPRGTDDDIAITAPDSGALVVTDSPGKTYSGSNLHAGAGCEQTGDSAVTCSRAAVKSIRVLAGNEADRVANTTEVPGTVKGETGDDVLVGGPSDDKLVGGPGVDSFSGKGGSDRLLARDGTADAKISCGPGSGGDRASLDLRPKDSPVRGCETVVRR